MSEVHAFKSPRAFSKYPSDGLHAGFELFADLLLVVELPLSLIQLSAQSIHHDLVLAHCLLALVELADE